MHAQDNAEKLDGLQKAQLIRAEKEEIVRQKRETRK